MINEAKLRKFYRDVLGYDGVCMATEDQFIEGARVAAAHNMEIALTRFIGEPGTKNENWPLVREAQLYGMPTYEPFFISNNG